MGGGPSADRLARRPRPRRGQGRVRRHAARPAVAPRGRDLARGERRRPGPRLPDQHGRHQVPRPRVPQPRRADGRSSPPPACSTARRTAPTPSSTSRTRSTPTGRPSTRPRSSCRRCSTAGTSSAPVGWSAEAQGKDHKFVSRILEQVREGRTTIYAVGDKFGTPTYTYDFGRCLLDLLDSDLYGLYHMACEGDGNRYDIASLHPGPARTHRHRAGRGRIRLLRRRSSRPCGRGPRSCATWPSSCRA